MDSAEDQGRIAKAIAEFLEIEDEFKAEKLKTLGAINTRKKALQAKVYSRLAKLNITRPAFEDSIKVHRNMRDGRNIFPRIDTGEDLELVGGFARCLLATGEAFKPLYDEATEKHMFELAEELMEEPVSDDDKVVDIREHEAA